MSSCAHVLGGKFGVCVVDCVCCRLRGSKTGPWGGHGGSSKYKALEELSLAIGY